MLLKFVAAFVAVVGLASAQNTPECLQCEFINGQYVFRDDVYCYMYHSCVSPLSSVASPRPCPFNQFYDNDSATCKWVYSIDCPSDPCKVAGTVSYANHLNCRSYFMCKNGKTKSEMCCAQGERYDPVNGCIADVTCTDKCPPPTSFECGDQRVYALDSTKYEQHVGSGIWMLRPCAPGTSFIAANLCKCIGSAPLVAPPCVARLNLPFNKNIQDIKLRKKVQNSRPKVRVVTAAGADGGKAAKFNGGTQRLIVPAYMNAFWGEELVIQTRFLETGVAPIRKEVILGNGDCGGDASVTIKYDRASSTTEAKIETKAYGGTVKTTMVSVTYVAGAGKWKAVELLYDSKNAIFRLTVIPQGELSQSDQKMIMGKILRKKAALQIGSGCPKEADNFVGFIDYVRVFPCV